MSTVSEKLLQVAENVPKVYHAGQLNIIENAECLKGNASGSAILIDDVSPVAHEMGVKVSGKNLIPYPYVTSSGSKINGITWTVNEDGSVTANGTATGNSNFVVISQANPIAIAGKTVTLSGCPTGGSSTTYGIYYYDTVTSQFDYGNGVTFIPKGVVTVNIRIYGGATVNNVVFKPQIEFGTTATAYTPYISDLTAVKVKRCGKNVLNPSLYLNTATFQGITYTTNSDTITLTGTARASSYVNIFSSNPDGVIPLPSILQNKKIKLYAYGNSYTVELLIRKTTGAGTVSANTNQSIDTTGATGFSIRCRFASGNTYNDSIKLMITEEGVENNTAYEPYITPTEYTPAADGTVNGVTSLYPNTTLMTDTEGVYIDCKYYKDIDKTYNKLSAEIALSGGE